MSIDPKKLASVLRVLRQHKVKHFKCTEFEVELHNPLQLSSVQQNPLVRESDKKQELEDDLFYSASINKVKGLSNGTK